MDKIEEVREKEKEDGEKKERERGEKKNNCLLYIGLLKCLNPQLIFRKLG